MVECMTLGEVRIQEIEKMVSIVQQLDITCIELLTRDANTLLMRKKMEECQPQPLKTG